MEVRMRSFNYNKSHNHIYEAEQRKNNNRNTQIIRAVAKSKILYMKFTH